MPQTNMKAKSLNRIGSFSIFLKFNLVPCALVSAVALGPQVPHVHATRYHRRACAWARPRTMRHHSHKALVPRRRARVAATPCPRMPNP